MRAVVVGGLCLAVAIGIAPTAGAQQADSSGVAGIIGEIKALGANGATVKKLVKELLNDPDVLNSVLDATLNDQRRPPLLKNLKVKFATFETADSNTRGLGLNYAYSYSIAQQQFSMKAAKQTGLDFRLNANGNVAFQRKLNPRDFLDTDVALSLFASMGGVSGTTTREVQARLAQLRDSLARIESPEELDHSPLMAEYLRLTMGRLSTQKYVDFAGTFGLESDQSFQQKNVVYGGRVALDIKAWNPASRLAKLNVFDWPFAVLRRLNGTDPSITPLGSTIPTVLAAIALVDPTDDDFRKSLGETDAYPRLNVEAAFRTLFMRTSVGPLYFQSDARWYRELSAPNAIRAQKIDKFSYFALALVSEEGPFVSYSKGRLPIDRKKDEVYELGFKLYF